MLKAKRLKVLQEAFARVDTVTGRCSGCEEKSILVAVVSDIYKCTECGEEMRQYINGSIKYLELTEKDKSWLKKNRLK